jgi:hypothetical protein
MMSFIFKTAAFAAIGVAVEEHTRKHREGRSAILEKAGAHGAHGKDKCERGRYPKQVTKLCEDTGTKTEGGDEVDMPTCCYQDGCSYTPFPHDKEPGMRVQADGRNKHPLGQCAGSGECGDNKFGVEDGSMNVQCPPAEEVIPTTAEQVLTRRKFDTAKCHKKKDLLNGGHCGATNMDFIERPKNSKSASEPISIKKGAAKCGDDGKLLSAVKDRERQTCYYATCCHWEGCAYNTETEECRMPTDAEQGQPIYDADGKPLTYE